MPPITLGPNQDPAYAVYGGIQIDLQLVRGFFTAESPKTEEQPEMFLWPLGRTMNDLEGFFLVTGLATVDFPLSLVGDTLTLPITIQKSLEKQRKQETTSADCGK